MVWPPFDRQTLPSYQAGGDSVYGSKLDSVSVNLCYMFHIIQMCVSLRL